METIENNVNELITSDNFQELFDGIANNELTAFITVELDIEYKLPCSIVGSAIIFSMEIRAGFLPSPGVVRSCTCSFTSRGFNNSQNFFYIAGNSTWGKWGTESGTLTIIHHPLPDSGT